MGAAAGSTLALALLVCGCVFAAMAGPALSLHTRSQALQQTLAGQSSTTKTVQVSSNWANFTGPLVDSGTTTSPNLTASELGETTREIGDGLAALRLPLAAGQWVGLTTKLSVVSGAGPRAQAESPPQARGGLPRPARQQRPARGGHLRERRGPGRDAGGGGHHADGRAVRPASGDPPVGGDSVRPGRALRHRDPAGARARLGLLDAGPHRGHAGAQRGFHAFPYWVGGVFADPGQLAAMQDAFGGPGMDLNWEFPLAVGGLTADQVQGLANALNRAATVTPPLTGTLAPSAGALTVTSPLISDLSLFLTTQAAVETVLLLLFVSLIATGAAVILLAARMIVARRAGELTMLRARGGSLRQVAAVMARAAVLAAGPAAVLGVGLAIALIPGAAAASSAGWPLAGIAVVAALAGPPAIAAWQYRKPSPGSNPARILSAGNGRPRRTWRRPVAEITACAAAAGALVVLHNQGLPAAGGPAGSTCT